MPSESDSLSHLPTLLSHTRPSTASSQWWSPALNPSFLLFPLGNPKDKRVVNQGLKPCFSLTCLDVLSLLPLYQVQACMVRLLMQPPASCSPSWAPLTALQLLREWELPQVGTFVLNYVSFQRLPRGTFWSKSSKVRKPGHLSGHCQDC